MFGLFGIVIIPCLVALPGSKVYGDNQSREATNQMHHLFRGEKKNLPNSEQLDYPAAVVNASKLLQPAVLAEEPRSGDGIDYHVEHRVHQEGLEVHPGEA